MSNHIDRRKGIHIHTDRPYIGVQRNKAAKVPAEHDTGRVQK